MNVSSLQTQFYRDRSKSVYKISKIKSWSFKTELSSRIMKALFLPDVTPIKSLFPQISYRSGYCLKSHESRILNKRDRFELVDGLKSSVLRDCARID